MSRPAKGTKGLHLAQEDGGSATAPAGIPSGAFTVRVNVELPGVVNLTFSDNGGGSVFSPPFGTLSPSAPTTTFTYTPSVKGVKSISLNNDGGLRNPPAWRLTARFPFIQGSDFAEGKLKGFAMGSVVDYAHSDADYADMVKTGANVLRVSFDATSFPTSPKHRIQADRYAKSDQVLLKAKQFNFKVILVLEEFIEADRGGPFWQDLEAQDEFAAIWKEIATKYRASTTIAGFELMIEPVVGLGESQSTKMWEPIARKAADQIRLVDTNQAIIIDSADWALPKAFYYMTPVRPNDENIVCSVHMYNPRVITHQGIYGYPLGVHYPSAAYDKKSMRADLQYVVDFQKEFNVPIYVGEFSCIRHAPGNTRLNYLRDSLSLASENRWSWTYQSWRTYDDWDAEIASSDMANKVRSPTGPVIDLLKESLITND